jgi:hypothetical protein
MLGISASSGLGCVVSGVMYRGLPCGAKLRPVTISFVADDLGSLCQAPATDAVTTKCSHDRRVNHLLVKSSFGSRLMSVDLGLFDCLQLFTATCPPMGDGSGFCGCTLFASNARRLPMVPERKQRLSRGECDTNRETFDNTELLRTTFDGFVWPMETLMMWVSRRSGMDGIEPCSKAHCSLETQGRG